MTKPTRERRRSPRIPAKLAMQIAGRDDASVLTTESINLSASGIQFGSRLFLSPLTKVALTLLLPPFGRRLRRERMLQCEGVIVRCEERTGSGQKLRYELACYFTDLTDTDRELIEQYVLWRTIRRLPSVNGEAASSKPRRRSAAP
jgi:PilZ domain